MLLWQNDAPMRRSAALPSELDDLFVVVVEVLYPVDGAYGDCVRSTTVGLSS